jgi:tetratricopeptide (TPR) repeat protein
MMNKMNSQVHHCLSWLAIAAAAMSSLLIVSAVLAQTENINTPLTDVYASSSAQASPNPVMPYPGQPGQLSGQQPLLPLKDGQFIPRDGTDGAMTESSPEKTCPPGMVCSSRRFEDDRLNMDKGRMEGMKRGLGQFVKGMAMVKKQVNRLVKKGLTPPAELTDALSKVNEIKTKIEAAQSPDELDELPEIVDEVSSVVEEWMPKLPRIAELPRVIKQAEREMTKLERAYKADEKKVKIKKLDLAENLSEFRQELDKAKTALLEAKELIKTKPDEAFDKLDDDFFANLDNVWEKEKIIQVALNIKSGITRMSAEIRSNQKKIATLKKKKIDTAELESDLATIKENFEEVKKIYNTKPVDVDELINAVEEMMDLMQELKDQIHDLTGQDEYEPKLMGEMKQVDFQMPSAFKFDKPKVEPKEEVSE